MLAIKEDDFKKLTPTEKSGEVLIRFYLKNRPVISEKPQNMSDNTNVVQIKMLVTH